MLILLSLAVTWLWPPSLVAANPPMVARLDVSQNGQIMKGDLRFDLAGGPVEGQVNLDVATGSSAPPKRQSGAVAAGRYKVRLDLKGTFAGGSYGLMNGTATISGVFRDQANCDAQLNGTGLFTGTVSAPLGLTEVAVNWEKVEFKGCDMSSPQPFSARLPAFAFEKTEKPVLPAAITASGTPTSGRSGLVLPDRPSPSLWAVLVGGICVGLVLFLGVVSFAAWLFFRRRRSVGLEEAGN